MLRVSRKSSSEAGKYVPVPAPLSILQCIYPNYIDKSKSTKQGRRLSHAKSVERPTVGEMLEIVQKYGIPFVLENKAYSRDWLIRGRIRVNLNDVKDESVNTSMLKH